MTSYQSYASTFFEQIGDSGAQNNDNQNFQNDEVLSTEFEHLYGMYMFRMKGLLALENQLTPLSILRTNLALSMEAHNTLPANSAIAARIHDLCCWHRNVIQQKNLTAKTFHEFVDRFPHKTEVKLKSLMKEVRVMLSKIAMSSHFLDGSS